MYISLESPALLASSKYEQQIAEIVVQLCTPPLCQPSMRHGCQMYIQGGESVRKSGQKKVTCVDTEMAVTVTT